MPWILHVFHAYDFMELFRSIIIPETLWPVHTCMRGKSSYGIKCKLLTPLTRLDVTPTLTCNLPISTNLHIFTCLPNFPTTAYPNHFLPILPQRYTNSNTSIDSFPNPTNYPIIFPLLSSYSLSHPHPQSQPFSYILILTPHNYNSLSG